MFSDDAKKLREIMGLKSQSAVAREIGVSQGQVSLWLLGENGISRERWLQILVKLGRQTTKAAEQQLEDWKFEEAQSIVAARVEKSKAGGVAQTVKPYVTKKKLDEYLEQEGLTDEQREFVRQQIGLFKKSNAKK